MNYKEIRECPGLSPTSIGPLLLRAEREFEKVYRALNLRRKYEQPFERADNYGRLWMERAMERTCVILKAVPPAKNGRP